MLYRVTDEVPRKSTRQRWYVFLERVHEHRVVLKRIEVHDSNLENELPEGRDLWHGGIEDDDCCLTEVLDIAGLLEVRTHNAMGPE